MTTQIQVAAFAAAYTEGNKAAQGYDPTKPDFKGAFQIADSLGFDRNSQMWEAAVGGAAAYYFNGHRF